MKKELKVKLEKSELFDSGIVISKNCTRGAQIQTAEEVYGLRGEALYHLNWGIRPVAFLLGMQFYMIMSAVANGKLFRIIKHDPAKREFPKLNKWIIKPIEGEQKNV